MTKVQIHFKLDKPLDTAGMARLADTSSLYGILGLKLTPELDGLTVNYDATRFNLNPAVWPRAATVPRLPAASSNCGATFRVTTAFHARVADSVNCPVVAAATAAFRFKERAVKAAFARAEVAAT
jgi:hypothetical protein